jgi:hypothetical protein
VSRINVVAVAVGCFNSHGLTVSRRHHLTCGRA